MSALCGDQAPGVSRQTGSRPLSALHLGKDGSEGFRVWGACWVGGWSLQCIEGVEGCCLSAGGVSENQSSGHHLKTGLQGLRLWFLNSSGSFQDHVFPSLCLSKGYFSDSGPRPTLVTQLLQVSGCWLTSSFLKFGNLRLRDKK